MDKANEAAQEWKERFNTQGVQLNAQIKQLTTECETLKQGMGELQMKYDDLERSGGHKAMAEKDTLCREIEGLKAKMSDIAGEKTNLQNQFSISTEDRERLNEQLTTTRKQLKETEDKVKKIEAQIDVVRFNALHSSVWHCRL